MSDIYTELARRFGMPREELKRRAYQHAYSGEPPRPKVEVLGPNDPLPAGVQLPQVVEVSEDIARQCWIMTTRAGQRFRVPATAGAEAVRRTDRQFPDVVLGRALETRSAVLIK